MSRALARRSKHATRFVDRYATWDEATTAATGYSQESILAQVEHATDAVIAGDAAFERDGVEFTEIEYRWPVAAGLMWQAALSRGTLRVLDFGGSLGSTYRQYRRLLYGVDARWGVVEQPAFVTAGARLADDVLSFHDSIDSCVQAIGPNVALLSSVLQYLPAPYDVLGDVASTGVETIIIDRTPMTELDGDVPAVQLVPDSIYSASYASWLLSRARIVSQLSDWDLVDTFPGIEPDLRSESGTPVRWLGMTFSRKPR